MNITFTTIKFITYAKKQNKIVNSATQTSKQRGQKTLVFAAAISPSTHLRLRQWRYDRICPHLRWVLLTPDFDAC